MNDNNSDAPLPSGWTKGYSKSQKKTYYCHPETKHTQWHFPTASEVADPLKAKQRLTSSLKKRQPDHSSSSSSSHQPPQKKQARHTASSSSTSNHASSSSSSSSRATLTATKDKTSVAIIVPYRDIHPKQNRKKHLDRFIPYMLQFLSKQLSKNTILDYHIYIIEQSNDDRKFNRGKLLNIGFDIAKKNKCRPKPKQGTNRPDDPIVDHNVFIFHDVDLLPTNEEVLGPYYTQFPTVPLHIARVWDRYSNNPKYFGGIVSFSESDMKKINGYPNTFWGWGGEDDEMQKRCEKTSLKWESPKVSTAAKTSGTPIITDLEEMNIQQKLQFLRNNRKWKCNVKWEALDDHEKTWKTNGLVDLDYKMLALTPLDGDRMKTGVRSRATKVTVDVKFNGNHWSNDKCHIDKM